MWGSTWFFAKLLASICPSRGPWIIPRLPWGSLSYMKISSLRATGFHPSPLWATPGPVQMSHLLSIPNPQLPPTQFLLHHRVPRAILGLPAQRFSILKVLLHLPCQPTFQEAWFQSSSSWKTARASSACGKAAWESEPANTDHIKALPL